MADSKIDDLLDELTAPTPGAGVASEQTEQASTRQARPMLLGFIVGLLVAVLAVVSFWFGTRSAEDRATTSAIESDQASPNGADQPEASAGDQGTGSEQNETDGTTPAPTPTSASTQATEDTTPVTLPAIEATEDNPSGAVRYSVFADGKFYLRGYISSEEAALRTVELVANAVGPENVVNEYIINAAAPLEVEAPVYVQDSILFDVDSAVLKDEFKPLLDGAPAFLAGDPNITIRVVARTDASGPADYNLELSRRRAEAVIDYYLSIGVDPARVEADPRGEEGSIETDDPEELARQRRVEFVVEGMFEN